MFRTRLICASLALVCLLALGIPAQAVQVDCDSTYCFTADDFSDEEPLAGICITGLPEAETGTMLLGARVLRPGDILTATQLEQVTFSPVATEQDADAVMTYLPIYEDRVETSAAMTISIRGKENKVPSAEDFAVETYKNLSNKGALKAADPEGAALTYTVLRQPRRGDVTVSEDGSFVYTPKKNKVGVDSFTYTATDTAGNVSREATVTIRILKPTADAQYTDTEELDCRFEAEWLRNTGLFEGEKLDGQNCFYPEKAVTQGEFLTMLIRLLDVPMEDETSYAALNTEAPVWLRPYLAAAVRAGLLSGWPETGFFQPEAAITGVEAAVLLQNALDLPYTSQTSADMEGKGDLPTWADTALGAMAENGIALTAEEPLTRNHVAKLLDQVSTMAADAPGTAVFHMEA